MLKSVFDRVENVEVNSIFSFSHIVLKKASFPDTSNGVIGWEWVKLFILFAAISNFLSLPDTQYFRFVLMPFIAKLSNAA